MDNLVKNLSKDDFKYLGHELYKNVLGLVKQKGYYSYDYMSYFENFKAELPSNRKVHTSLTDRKLVIKHMNMFLMFRINLK